MILTFNPHKIKGGDSMINFLDDIDDFLSAEERAKLNVQFVEDNFCPFDEDPFTYEHEGINLLDEHMY